MAPVIRQFQVHGPLSSWDWRERSRSKVKLPSGLNKSQHVSIVTQRQTSQRSEVTETDLTEVTEVWKSEVMKTDLTELEVTETDLTES